MKLLWTRLALEDLKHLYDYIAEDNVSAAKGMVSRIRQGAEKLKKHPHMGKTGRVENTRELLIAQSPYIAVYTLQQDRIAIIAVLHSSQRWPDSFSEG